MITYKQIKDEIMALGLSNPEEYENYKDAVVPAVNAAHIGPVQYRCKKTPHLFHHALA